MVRGSEAWRAAVHGVTVRHNLTKAQQKSSTVVKWIRENLVLVLDHPIISWVSKKYITFKESDNPSRPPGKAAAKIPVSVISPARGIDLGINVYTSMTDRYSNQIEVAPSFRYSML